MLVLINDEGKMTMLVSIRDNRKCLPGFDPYERQGSHAGVRQRGSYLQGLMGCKLGLVLPKILPQVWSRRHYNCLAPLRSTKGRSMMKA